MQTYMLLQDNSKHHAHAPIDIDLYCLRHEESAEIPRFKWLSYVQWRYVVIVRVGISCQFKYR